MSNYTMVAIEIRRADRNPVFENDLNDFEKLFDDFDDLGWCERYDYPHICTDGKRIHASGMLYHSFEECNLGDFAETHPHLQIEVIEEGEYGKARHLFEGELYECCGEVSYFEPPVLIDWKENE